ncbi:uncharacterized protein LOC133285942 [Gastrolobium bilobum]|uniref:uncharacterized protein LOC133285942 n=1 Tax=Gastrolobium bilobum TaxID=150636 RepID=UPI002AB13052|nr:uncharacterized protein LOC133285942 [Gastrolobium bilobum]
MNVLSWNCRGAVKRQFKSTFSRFRNKYKVSVAAILEPRVSGNKDVRIIKSLGFTNYSIVEAQGFSGGIWLMWNASDVKISCISKHEQYIHCWVEFSNMKGFFFTAVYVSPHEGKRRILWEELKHIGRTMEEPWLLSGDFNEITYAEEKRGGGIVDYSRCNQFTNVLDACGVLDLGGGGNRFTWRGPKFLHLNRVFKRLDRAVANEIWRASFEDADVLTLPRLFSDHCPILVRLEKEETDWRERPFRFLASWQYDPRFSPFLKANWNQAANLCDSLNSFTPALKDWNRDVFGFIQYKKNRIISRLDGIQKVSSSNNSKQLEKLESKLKDELSGILDQEEQLWHQKSRGNWIRDGDRNTRLYHTSTLIRRKRNKIIKLQDEAGHWISREEELIELARNFFLNLFKDEAINPVWVHTSNNWPDLKEDQLASLSLDVDLEEKYLREPDLIKEIDHTLLALIPKVEKPCLMKQFRPIAFCNFVYKGLNKILVNKIKPLLGSLISPNQVSFVPKRSVLEEVKFPANLIDAILGCVTSPCLEVLWNGARTPGFSSQRGIRQGDPISPYLFVLCMEKLTHLILDEVEAKRWRPMRAGKAGPLISHLMFADDVILFAEASMDQLESIAHCLEKFSLMSGQCVSVEKSCIFFSKNVAQETIDSITAVSGFKRVSSLGCYLGALMRHGRVKRDHYADTISRVQGRLQGWKSKCFSLAGRITLAKSVISAIPSFHMQNSMLPVHVCQEIERLQRNFIWGDSDVKKRAHYVSWEQLCLPKNCGGLGFLDLRRQNAAFMQKLAWKVMNDQNSLWVQVMLGKYGRNLNPNRALISKGTDSPLWKYICTARDNLSQHLEWVVGNGKETCFWTDLWGGWKRSLYELVVCKPPNDQLPLKVCDYVDPDTGEWRWYCLLNWLDPNTLNKLKGIRPPVNDVLDDRLNWLWSRPNMSFVRNAYCYMSDFSVGKDKIWAAIWRWKGPYRITVFIWLACLNKIPVRTMTGQWSGGDLGCPTCYYSHETVLHVLRDCRVARQGSMSSVNACVVSGGILNSELAGKHKSACGGLAVSSSGEWKGGFSANLGTVSVLEAKLWGVYHGLKMAGDLCYTKVWMGCDSKEAILCLEEDSEICGFTSLICKIRSIAQDFDQLQLEFIPRKSNDCADFLAKLGFSCKGEELMFFSSPPVDILPYWLELCSNMLMEQLSLYMHNPSV